MRERDIEEYLCDRVSAMGGEVRKVKWLGRNSAPDRRVMLPGRCFWAELKATGEEPTGAQLREHVRMRAAGERVEVIDSLASVEDALQGA